jgi:cellulose synthase (UDP-forming)
VAGIVRVLWNFNVMQTVSLLILLFWIVRNLYYLVMALFLIDGRDYDGEVVRVNDAEIVQVSDGTRKYDGVTTLLTEHNLTVFLDEAKELRIGTPVDTEIFREGTAVVVSGVVTAVRESRRGTSRTHTIEILDDHGNRMEYLQVLYDRIPSLPQSLHGDYGALFDLWQNIAHRVARTMK